jgi:Mrp family chromosome partitioning ATPase
MRQLVTAAAAEYDFVILDSPPVLPHEADVQSLAALADSVLLIVRQGVTPRDSVSLAVSRLTRVSGVVLNAFESRHVPVDRNHAATAAL